MTLSLSLEFMMSGNFCGLVIEPERDDEVLGLTSGGVELEFVDEVDDRWRGLGGESIDDDLVDFSGVLLMSFMTPVPGTVRMMSAQRAEATDRDLVK